MTLKYKIIFLNWISKLIIFKTNIITSDSEWLSTERKYQINELLVITHQKVNELLVWSRGLLVELIKLDYSK